MRSPLTHVPLDDPRSVTHQPAGNRSRIAWRWLAMGSSSRATSFSAALPTVVRSASREKRQLRAPDITSICGYTQPKPTIPPARLGRAALKPELEMRRGRVLGGQLARVWGVHARYPLPRLAPGCAPSSVPTAVPHRVRAIGDQNGDDEVSQCLAHRPGLCHSPPGARVTVPRRAARVPHQPTEGVLSQ